MSADLRARALPRPSGRAGLGARLRRTILCRLDALQHGSLTVCDPDGHGYHFQGAEVGPEAHVDLHRDAALWRLVVDGDLGFAEAYLDGAWSTPDLAALLELGALNERALGALVRPTPLTAALRRVRHHLRRNTRRGARRNIAAHYDLGNDFYRLWLDPDMVYSAADWREGAASLETAQQAKLAAMAGWLEARPGERVLEIGCGWGSLACLLAGRHGVHVHGLTLSSEQLAATRERADALGVADRVHAELRDYRDVDGQYDHIVSVEMLEAVGERYWRTWFRQLHDRLRPGGRAAVQVIVIDDEAFDGYRQGADFIQTHIFPGGMLPSPAVLDRLAADVGLVRLDRRHLAPDYARTLEAWRARFNAVIPELEALGFDARFRRAWNYYLDYCRAGFVTGRLDLLQVLWQRPGP